MRLRIALIGVAMLAMGTLAFGASSVDAAAGGNGHNAITVAVDCNGPAFDVVINGSANSPWPPGHIVGGGTFVVTSQGEVTSTFTDSSGTVTDTTPPITKGNAEQHSSNLMTCSFSFSGTDPESGGTFSVSGTVTGFIAGGGR